MIRFKPSRYSIISGNERMAFTMEPDTGVLRLSNKRRQGMKLSYQLNVSVSDGVFTSTAQVGLACFILCWLFTDGELGDLH